jgi:chemotaxis response regulator CheB
MGWPSVDLFLEGMAAHHKEEGIAVILSGMLRDGASGIAAVRRAGGATMVQHPQSAAFPDMPNAAVDLGRADLMRTPAGIAQALEVLAKRGVE